VDFPAPSEGFVVTQFIVAAEVARSRDFYSGVLGGKALAGAEFLTHPRSTAARSAATCAIPTAI
jgi:hypothetical protein